MVGIYYILNKVNNKMYVGQSVNIKSRIANHRWKLRHGLHTREIQKDFNIYGESSFEFGVFIECEEWELNTFEEYFIFGLDLYLYGYNSNYGGESPIFFEEFKSNCKQNMIGKFTGSRNPNYGKHLSEETRKKISDSKRGTIPWNKGMTFSKDISLTRGMGGKTHSEESKAKMGKSIVMLTLEYEFIKKFNTMKEASDFTNISKASICRCCKATRGNQKCKNYIFMYSDDYDLYVNTEVSE